VDAEGILFHDLAYAQSVGPDLVRNAVMNLHGSKSKRISALIAIIAERSKAVH
jgi:hypothetical protein